MHRVEGLWRWIVWLQTLALLCSYTTAAKFQEVYLEAFDSDGDVLYDPTQSEYNEAVTVACFFPPFNSLQKDNEATISLKYRRALGRPILGQFRCLHKAGVADPRIFNESTGLPLSARWVRCNESRFEITVVTKRDFPSTFFCDYYHNNEHVISHDFMIRPRWLTLANISDPSSPQVSFICTSAKAKPPPLLRFSLDGSVVTPDGELEHLPKDIPIIHKLRGARSRLKWTTILTPKITGHILRCEIVGHPLVPINSMFKETIPVKKVLEPAFNATTPGFIDALAGTINKGVEKTPFRTATIVLFIMTIVVIVVTLIILHERSKGSRQSGNKN